MISVPLAPFGKPRPRVTRRGKHTYMPPKYEKWRDDFVMLFQAAGGETEIRGAISMRVIFVFKMPKSWSQKRKKETEGTWCLKRPDLDNCIGSVMDAILAEDSTVVHFHECAKIWGYEDEIRVEITAEDDAPYVPF